MICLHLFNIFKRICRATIFTIGSQVCLTMRIPMRLVRWYFSLYPSWTKRILTIHFSTLSQLHAYSQSGSAKWHGCLSSFISSSEWWHTQCCTDCRPCSASSSSSRCPSCNTTSRNPSASTSRSTSRSTSCSSWWLIRNVVRANQLSIPTSVSKKYYLTSIDI